VIAPDKDTGINDKTLKVTIADTTWYGKLDPSRL
jgi:hypothetical protein